MDTPRPMHSGGDGASNPPMTSAGKRYGFIVVRDVLGVLLLAAAGLKFADAGFGSAGVYELYASPFWLRAVLVAETLVGVWLLVGLAPRALWFFTLVFFSVLACLSLYMGINGQQSCGCFGTKLPVHPWYTAVLDSGAVAALLFWQPIADHNAGQCARFRGTAKTIVGAVFLLGIVGVATAAYAHLAGYLAPDGVLFGDDQVVMLQPEKWVGKSLPLMAYIETAGVPAEDLRTGEWLLLLVHSDCSKCREVLPRFEQLAKDRVAHGFPARVVVIDLPPYDASKPFPATPLKTFCQRGSLTPQREWFAKTSALIKMVDGMVIEVDTALRP